MYYLYVLKSRKDELLYIGSTNDLRRRLADHNSGKVQSTMSRRPFEIRYYEAYISESDARKREASLKRDGRALSQLKNVSLNVCNR
ncbi:MAG: GIY-YIG nuclease family protein [bacterium]|nr:GIY-YIG nuclease family protein [bacterium]